MAMVGQPNALSSHQDSGPTESVSVTACVWAQTVSSPPTFQNISAASLPQTPRRVVGEGVENRLVVALLAWSRAKRPSALVAKRSTAVKLAVG